MDDLALASEFIARQIRQRVHDPVVAEKLMTDRVRALWLGRSSVRPLATEAHGAAKGRLQPCTCAARWQLSAESCRPRSGIAANDCQLA